MALYLRPALPARRRDRCENRWWALPGDDRSGRPDLHAIATPHRALGVFLDLDGRGAVRRVDHLGVPGGSAIAPNPIALTVNSSPKLTVGTEFAIAMPYPSDCRRRSIPSLRKFMPFRSGVRGPSLV